jgi:asparagine synthase (glutamine-hydrolysing)
MCGICGKLQLRHNAPPVALETLHRMLGSIEHRGPDDAGVYRSGPVGLGHRRLKIIDLNTGKQPLCNEDGTVWVIYNGEVYNFVELRSDLVKKGHCFKSVSDTEVIVHLYEEFGAECVNHLRGMFSFALWDDKTKTLLLARDRVGIKPLYYCQTPTTLLFASEVKAILAEGSIEPEIDPVSLHYFLSYFYVPGDRTLFKQIRKLEPGHYMIVRNGEAKITQYWDLTFNKSTTTFEDAVAKLDHLLSRTVRDHMISDVPVGVLLSGGVDSSGVLSYAVENTSHPIRTYTVGFDGGCTDERPYARAVAKAYSAHNHDISISAQAFWEFLPKYVWHMEEPVCEPPAVALYYVSKLASQDVTVLLSGEGGDEAFAGYQSYRNFAWVEKVKRWMGPLAGPLGTLSSYAFGDPESRYGKYGPLLQTSLDQYYYSHSSGPYEFFNHHRSELYTSEFKSSIRDVDPVEAVRKCFKKVSGLSVLDQMLYVDSKTWLPDDLLIKADKMTMANSVELRVPLLDHQVLEFAASLPPAFKLRGANMKHILKKALSKRLPREILNRKKTGFPVPYVKWMSDDLRPAISEMLLDEQTIGRGYFNRKTIERILSEPAARSKYSKELFSLTVLELWHRTFVKKEVPCFT